MKRYRPRSGSGPSSTYEIGYRKPPEHSRFQPGQSGNPRGRPKGVRNFKTDVKATLRAPVSVTRDGKPRKITTQAAMLLRLREKALAGDARALDRLLALASTYGDDEVVAPVDVAAEDQALLDLFRQRVTSGAADLPADSASRRSPPKRKRRGKKEAS